MKLIIQIPCYNEGASLGETVAAIPRDIEGIDRVELLVIDDGSSDDTAEVARSLGVEHVIRLPRNQGLAKAFLAGLDASLRAGADIIVNTDADNQYRADDIPALVAPILEGRADIAVGERPIWQIQEFSPTKKLLQRIGSKIVRLVSSTNVADAPSGFRAFSRNAAMQINVFSDYTYTLETVIQAGHKAMAIASVPIRTNPKTRPSRLVSSTLDYVWRSALTIIRIFMTYRPFHFFAVPGGFLLLGGLGLAARFLYYFVQDQGQGHVQSVILAALMMGTGAFMIMVGLVSDLISVNRKLLEKIHYRVQRMELDGVFHRDSKHTSRPERLEAAPPSESTGQRCDREKQPL